MKRKIRMQVVSNRDQHFVVQFERPGRIEVSLSGNKIIAFVYSGAKIDMEQEPLGMFDGTLGPNTGWRK